MHCSLESGDEVENSLDKFLLDLSVPTFLSLYGIKHSESSSEKKIKSYYKLWYRYCVSIDRLPHYPFKEARTEHPTASSVELDSHCTLMMGPLLT
jgi:hypothetical protein